MKNLREIAGYMLGGLLFVLLIPAVMWLASGTPSIAPISVFRISVALLMMLGGLAMSIWTIVYMRQRGKGNPMDAFGHEVAPRTQHLMTDGAYRISRSAMHLAGSTCLVTLLSHYDGTSHQRRTSSSSRLWPGIQHLPPPHPQVLILIVHSGIAFYCA